MRPTFISFVESPAFTSRVARMGLEDDLRSLQLELVAKPDRGALDPQTGGLRKIRLSDAGRSKGKRGGARAHYLWLPHLNRIYLLFVYGKSEQDVLTAVQKRALKEVVQRIRREARL